MFKFFRQLRQKLISGNSLSKYLLYAIGEIILVVIGILIALQINNRNEKQKVLEKEIEILRLFQESLTADLEKFEKVAAFFDLSKGSIDRILDHLENDLPFTDTLAYDFFNSTYVYEQSSFTNGVFEALKSTGIELISNKNLRQQIAAVYDDTDPWMESVEKRYIDIMFEAKREVYKTRFDQFWGGTQIDAVIVGKMYPLNFSALKTDKEYTYFLQTQLNLMYWLIEKPLLEGKTRGTLLKESIEKELELLAK
jgi:hypothetical protein